MLRGRRLHHVRRVLRAKSGDQLCVGLAEGPVGRGTLTRLEPAELELDLQLDSDPPPALEATLALALPRPPVLSRVIAAVTSLGVKRIVLFHSRRVEKTFWDSRAAQPDYLREASVLGLEQARDTRLPEIELQRYFRPFAEDVLPKLAVGRCALVAHPEANSDCPARIAPPALLVIGPEGGFLAHEIEAIEAAGARCVGLGARLLRVETAVPVLLSRVL